MELNQKVLDVFKLLINDIIMVSQDEDTIQTKYNDILNMDLLEKIEDCELINNFIKNIETHTKKIVNKDETVFNNEIIDGVSLTDIWANEETTIIAKNNIWKYLQTFCIININLNSSNELQQLLSGEVTEINKENRKDLKDIKNIKKLKNSIADINKDNKDNNAEMNPEGFNEIFTNTGIGQLAKEIAEDIDFESLMGDTSQGDNPEDILGNMMNSGNIMGLFSSINQKVQEKIKSGNLSEETLSGEAETLYEGFKGNAMFENLMKNPEISKMQENMKKQANTTQEMPDMSQLLQMAGNMMNSMPPGMQSGMQQGAHMNKTQERLQKKLQKRQSNK